MADPSVCQCGCGSILDESPVPSGRMPRRFIRGHNRRSAVVCTVFDCGKRQHAKGYCSTHYGHVRRRGNPVALRSPVRPARTRPSHTDLHWAAGFLEGEAHFGYGGSSHRVVAAGVRRAPLRRLRRLFGGTISMRKAQTIRHRDCEIWQVSGARARGIMMTLYTILSPGRREQIRESLTHG